MHRVTEQGTEITMLRSVPRRHPRQWGNPEKFYREITFEERMLFAVVAMCLAMIVSEFIFKPLNIGVYE